MRTLDGKLALITGAAAGIGRALAVELARAGTHLVLVDIDGRGLIETTMAARSRGGRVEACLADLACEVEVRRVAQLVHKRYGKLDILVNNAGVAYYGSTHEMAEDQWRRVLAVNLLAPIQLTHELLPCLFVPPEAHVLNMGSIAGLVGSSRLAAYNATKFAVVGFSESLRAEYGPRGLGVTAFCPGLVRTGIFENAMTAGNKQPPRFPNWLASTPESVARRAVRAIRKNQGLVVTSSVARAIWRLKRLSPWLLDRIQQFRRVRHSAPTPAPAMPGVTVADPFHASHDLPTRRAA